jgi:hypothetical protein
MTIPRNVFRSSLGLLAAGVSFAATAAAQQSCPTTSGATMPLKYKGGPTVAAITPCDLMTRLYIYADDSMLGREAGTPNAIRATAYIESQVRALGLKPGGDHGTFFQYLNVVSRAPDSSASMLMVGNAMFSFGKDFTSGAALNVSGQAVYGGVQGDTLNPLTADQVRGKLVIVSPAAAPAGGGRGGFGRGGGRGGRGFGGGSNPFAEAAAVLTVTGPELTAGRGGFGGGRGGVSLVDSVQIEGQAAYAAANPQAGGGRGRGGFGGGFSNVTITDKVAEALLGKPLAQATKGEVGTSASVSVVFRDIPAPTRNVIAILPGSDPRLKGEYVVIGAHSDHVGFNNRPVEHDSLKAYNMIARVEGADSRGAAPATDEELARINAIKDSLRKIYPAREDSISNGADDDGSGSVSVLEIAQAFAKLPAKPKRSILFIWQVGEEKGLWGSQWFTNHPTVPRDSIVADLNMDMVGRGAATDVTGQANDSARSHLHGGPGYLQLVGSRRLSTELGDIVEQVNTQHGLGFNFDYAMDANGHPQNIYCRSDHANYARYGIPVVFFTTGGHADYHQVTDEPEYIQYSHMAKVSQLVYDIAMTVGNLDHRVVVDKPKPDSPFGRCQQ